MDEDLKAKMEQVCADMGMSMTPAFTIFAKKVSREHRIPFEVSADPFYSESYPLSGENYARCQRGESPLCRA
ncbi:type II toxin-antitoxin system RelB/DinJ family antitoxin [uncultured Intestinimonas sp.]|uniref:type II toxin-antitoxin system RelB/DinJ family antitoxin n=1 Tax=uncultured Intestinimonas sp. TaxID=1689265 RepID=UPI00343200CD